MRLPARVEALPAITHRVVSGIQFYVSTRNSIVAPSHDFQKIKMRWQKRDVAANKWKIKREK